MISQPTVLVLGAGASIPYGYPSGRDLLDSIRKNLVPRMETELKTKLIKLGFKRRDIDVFRQELGLADPDSVDAFLENRSEFIDLGKLVIALCLVPFERGAVLFGPKGSDKYSTCWYSYLMKKLHVRYFTEFANNQLSIITFNYDRSLEHYLFTVLKHRYNAQTDEVADALDLIPIIHVHGSLSALPWQRYNQSRAYGKADDLKEIQVSSKQILVMSEKDDQAPVFEKAHGLLARAKKIYFLGFGYHVANLRRLKVDSLANKRVMYGTSYGLGAAEWRSISDEWRITFSGKNVDILGLFRDYHPL